MKPTLNIAFANLPYLIDGETRLVQSNAILRYLGRKCERIITALRLVLRLLWMARLGPSSLSLLCTLTFFPRLLVCSDNLMGNTETESTMLDQLLEQAADLDNSFTGLCYGGWSEEARKAAYVAALPATLAQCESRSPHRPVLLWMHFTARRANQLRK
eukprot:SAG11_NODE_5281_length_1607_cov_1.398541_1_plen_158_part_00